MQFLLVWESRNLQHKMKKKTFIRVISYKFIKWINKNPRFHVTLCFIVSLDNLSDVIFTLQLLYTHPLIKQKVRRCLRYVDDIFFTWTVSGNELQQFMIKINEVHSSIRYNFNYWKTQIPFLDIPIKKHLQENFWQHNTEKKLTSSLILIENQSTLKLLNKTSPIHWD